MKIIADLEVHSKYARAVSQQMTVPTIAEWATKKGIDLVGTGGFTHPMWSRELQASLEEAGSGIYKLKGSEFLVRFLLTSELSCIYSHAGKVRRVHIMVFLPTLSDVEKFNKELTLRGANLFSDGRPIIGLTLSQVLEVALSVNPKAIVIPAHVWTPWFGFYGANGGYDSLAEAFGDLEKFIPAIETGMSSDPAMNWRIEELVGKSIVSFGDAHSPAKLGREATVFEMEEISYENLRRAIVQSSDFSFQLSDVGLSGDRLVGKPKTEKPETENRQPKPDNRIAYTIEFYPEEGKYHYTGHRNCEVVYSPNKARKLGTICPVCGRPLTVGVMSRVENLASLDVNLESVSDKFGVRWIYPKGKTRPPYVMLVPLLEILSESLESGVSSQKVLGVYEQLVSTFGSEFKVLLETDVMEIEKAAGFKIAQGISKVRSGDISIEPGYDGVFGKVKIWPENKEAETAEVEQESLF